jgi:alginate O-acetyltransferase complex protein AlgI
MIFNSYSFLLIFLPLALAGFGLLLRLNQGRGIIWLLSLFSLAFYAAWNPLYIPLLLCSIISNYTAGRAIRNSEGTLRRAILIAGIVFNLGLLAYFKYANFFLETLHSVAGSEHQRLDIILPLAISFFTFQQLAFLVDCYQGICEEQSFGRYLLFVSFFPQLIAGPIVHHKEMMPQFHRESILDKLDIKRVHGIVFLTIGLTKKVIFADTLAPYSIALFDGQGVPSTVDAWLGTTAYSLQLYFDFSGYTDMAIGIALLFGIRLPDNFDSPYKAGSIIEFWRRWHMTLSRFLRDYLYIPLGGNRKGPGRRYFNLLATMLLGGLWHGAAWTFVIWGALHGLMLTVNHAWHFALRKLNLLGLQRNSTYRVAMHILTLVSVMSCWVIFRAPDLERAGTILTAMFIPGANSLAPSEINTSSVTIIFALLLGSLITLFAPNTKEILTAIERVPTWWQRYRESLPNRALPAFGLALLAMLLLSKLNSFSEFLYFQF